ncbi:separin protein [Conglomerata obtusa]
MNQMLTQIQKCNKALNTRKPSQNMYQIKKLLELFNDFLKLKDVEEMLFEELYKSIEILIKNDRIPYLLVDKIIIAYHERVCRYTVQGKLSDLVLEMLIKRNDNCSGRKNDLLHVYLMNYEKKIFLKRINENERIIDNYNCSKTKINDNNLGDNLNTINDNNCNVNNSINIFNSVKIKEKIKDKINEKLKDKINEKINDQIANDQVVNDQVVNDNKSNINKNNFDDINKNNFDNTYNVMKNKKTFFLQQKEIEIKNEFRCKSIQDIKENCLMTVYPKIKTDITNLRIINTIEDFYIAKQNIEKNFENIIKNNFQSFYKLNLNLDNNFINANYNFLTMYFNYNTENTFENRENTCENREITFENRENPFENREITFDNTIDTFQNDLNTFEKRENTIQNDINTSNSTKKTFEITKNTFEFDINFFNLKSDINQQENKYINVHLKRNSNTNKFYKAYNLYKNNKHYLAKLEFKSLCNDIITENQFFYIYFYLAITHLNLAEFLEACYYIKKAKELSIKKCYIFTYNFFTEFFDFINDLIYQESSYRDFLYISLVKNQSSDYQIKNTFYIKELEKINIKNTDLQSRIIFINLNKKMHEHVFIQNILFNKNLDIFGEELKKIKINLMNTNIDIELNLNLNKVKNETEKEIIVHKDEIICKKEKDIKCHNKTKVLFLKFEAEKNDKKNYFLNHFINFCKRNEINYNLKYFMNLILKNKTDSIREQRNENGRFKNHPKNILNCLQKYQEHTFISFYVLESFLTLNIYENDRDAITLTLELNWNDITNSFLDCIKNSKETLQRIIMNENDKKNWWKDRINIDNQIKKIIDNINSYLKKISIKNKNIFIIIDELTTNFPIELLDIFKNKSVYRIPSFDYLEKVKYKKHEILIKNIFFMLDPDNNLESTRKRVIETFERIKRERSVKTLDEKNNANKAGMFLTSQQTKDHKNLINNQQKSDVNDKKSFLKPQQLNSYINIERHEHIINQKPFYEVKSEEDTNFRIQTTHNLVYNINHIFINGIVGCNMKDDNWNAVKKSEVFFYFGHGNAEKYIGKKTFKNFKNKLVFLFGCSSSKTSSHINFKRNGIVLEYLNYCKNFFGCLWDVTDKDLDRFTIDFLEELLLSANQIDLGQIISKHRSCMKLKYLNGGALVMWGVPSIIKCI